MKSTYTLLLLSFLLFSCKKDEKNDEQQAEIVNNWKDFKLTDNVKSVTEKSYNLENGKKGKAATESPSRYDINLAFNTTGSLIEEKKILPDGVILEETTFLNKDKKLLISQYVKPGSAFTTKYSWDDNGNNTIITRRNPQGEQIEKTLNTFIKNQRVEVRRFDGKDNLTERTTYTFGSNDKVREEKGFQKETTVQYITTYTYDNNNNILTEQRLSPDYKRLYTINNKYTAKNLLLETETLNKDDKQEYSEIRTYDAKGNMTSNRVYDGFIDSKSIEEFKYDTNNNMTERKEIVNQEIITHQLLTYDNHNNVIVEKTIGRDGKLIVDRKTHFEYDKKGNWIKKTVSINGEAKFLVERTITYF
ncbi:hypothetical protein [Flavobacterium cerinum]|uniref:DUF4595 domain-containing protein n=1 Tax=Flavobacterium cerinum TaxID=2502784 RepID=A0ABY5IQA3_9FLAO|nr:hypothetical protein [Flavobacterium cerinum]UUC43968.1 hypothetical protein NOX80_10010 [Flavobacterium cerinum]